MREMGTVSAVQRKASVKVALYGLQGFDRQLDRYMVYDIPNRYNKGICRFTNPEL